MGVPLLTKVYIKLWWWFKISSTVQLDVPSLKVKISFRHNSEASLCFVWKIKCLQCPIAVEIQYLHSTILAHSSIPTVHYDTLLISLYFTYCSRDSCWLLLLKHDIINSFIDVCWELFKFLKRSVALSMSWKVCCMIAGPVVKCSWKNVL